MCARSPTAGSADGLGCMARLPSCHPSCSPGPSAQPVLKGGGGGARENSRLFVARRVVGTVGVAAAGGHEGEGLALREAATPPAEVLHLPPQLRQLLGAPLELHLHPRLRREPLLLELPREELCAAPSVRARAEPLRVRGGGASSPSWRLDMASSARSRRISASEAALSWIAFSLTVANSISTFSFSSSTLAVSLAAIRSNLSNRAFSLEDRSMALSNSS